MMLYLELELQHLMVNSKALSLANRADLLEVTLDWKRGLACL